MNRSELLSILNKKKNISLNLFREYFKETNKEGIEDFVLVILNNRELMLLAANNILNYYKTKHQIVKLEGNNTSFYY